MTIDERIASLTMNLELLSRDHEALRARHEATDRRVAALLTAVEQDAENIRGLVRIAELHERRLTDLEGGDA